MSRVVTACVALVVGSFGALFAVGEVWNRTHPIPPGTDFGVQMGIAMDGVFLSLGVSLVLMVLIGWWGRRYAGLPWWWAPGSWFGAAIASQILSLLYPLEAAAVAVPFLLAIVAVARHDRARQRPLLVAAGIAAALAVLANAALAAAAGVLW